MHGAQDTPRSDATRLLSASASGDRRAALAKFYAMWHEAEPDAGHDAEAAVWEARAAEMKSGG